MTAANGTKAQGIPARRAAVQLLTAILGEARPLSDLLADGALSDLPPPERARAQRLTLETLRGLERADRLFDEYLRREPPLVLRNILRLGTVELCAGGAAHGVVNDCVALAGQLPETRRMKGLVNAVLRKVAAAGPDAWPKMRPPRLPDWLRTRLIAAWGADAVAAMEAAHLAGAPLDLTPKDAQAATLAEALGGSVLPTGSVRVAAPAQVSALPGYAEGDWWAQDAASALPVRMLAPMPGEAVLDLCAAPGGKTMQLAAAGARVTAVESNARRAERITENLARTGLDAEIVIADARSVTGSYDAVLLDAPCSATGTIRRHPDLPFVRDGSGLEALVALQAELLDHALAQVRPGGRVVFCTCSLLPDEGEAQATAALARHPGLVVVPPASELGTEPGWTSPEGGLRLRPDFWSARGGLDGFYAVTLRTPA